jgi:hypothetical protein
MVRETEKRRGTAAERQSGDDQKMNNEPLARERHAERPVQGSCRQEYWAADIKRMVM